MSKKLSLALMIILILMAVQRSYSEVIVHGGKRYVDVSSYNSLVDDNNIKYDMLVETKEMLELAEKNLISVTKMKCPSQKKNKIIIGSICITIGLALGFGFGFGLAWKK